jgi:hypothetical protein
MIGNECRCGARLNSKCLLFSVFVENEQFGAVIFSGFARLRYGTEGDVRELLGGLRSLVRPICKRVFRRFTMRGKVRQKQTARSFHCEPSGGLVGIDQEVVTLRGLYGNSGFT